MASKGRKLFAKPSEILLSAALAVGACAAPPLPLDEVLGPGQARVGKVHKDSELIGGPVAYGRAGDVWKLYNSRARFLIQDQGTSVGLDLYGGNLIDADLVRPGDDGKNGNDLFRETFPIVGLRVPNPTSIEVIADGSKGGEAHLRVHAADAASGIIPQLDAIGRELGGELVTDYILAPDVPYLKMVTTYTATAEQHLDGIVLGDFLSFGASLTLISPENGFTGEATTVSFIGSVGERSSYGYVYPEGELNIPLVDASGTVTLLKNPSLSAGEQVSVSRYLVVGDGDAASVMGPMYALRGIATSHLSGTVVDANQRPLAGAKVTLFKAPFDPKDPDQSALNQATTHADGGYQFDVPDGEYAAVVTAIGMLRSAPVAISLHGERHQDLKAGAGGSATFDIAELVAGKRQPVPAKVSFLGQDVEAPDPRFGPDPTESERNGVHALALLADGTGQIAVKPGTYDVVISRGPEYELVRQNGVVIPPGGSVPIKGELVRVVDTQGWISGDYHQHTQGSIDSPVPLQNRVIEDLAEGVEFPSTTDHDNITDFRPHIQKLHAGSFINGLCGDEISVNGVGHFNAYPLSVNPQDPYAKIGAKLWANTTIAGMVDRVRGLEPDRIILHISHPRSKSLGGYFNSIHFDPISGDSDEPEDVIGKFDAIEVNGELGQPEDFLAANDSVIQKKATAGVPNGVPTLRDFFSMLNRGKTVCALGNSDTHQRNDDTGYPRNYLFVGKDDPSQITPAEIVAAIRTGQVSVSNGPFVTVKVNNVAAFGKAQPVSLHGAASAQLNIKVQAPAWVGVSTLEVYENGRPLPLNRTGPAALEAVAAGTVGATLAAAIQPTDGHDAVRFDGAVKVAPTRDAYYVVVVRGAGSLRPVAGSSPYGYTNPIYVDTAGDGWTPAGM